MKIKDVITEDVDMSFWAEIDSHVNPEARTYAEKQEQRLDMLNKAFEGTPVFTKPVRQPENNFSNTPKSDQPKSAGYAGNVDTRIRAGHITNDEGKKLLDTD